MDFKDRLQYSLNNKFLSLIVLGILLVVNVLSLQVFHRFDLTRGQQYSISESTKTILHNLDDLLTVTAYISPDLPPQIVPVEQYLTDILSEYQAYGSGNVQVDILKVDSDEREQEALAAGMTQAEMQVLENDSYQVRRAFFGLQMLYQGKTESIPLIQQSELANLEYDLTSLVLKMSQPELSTVAFLSGHGEHSIESNLVAPGQPDGNDYKTLVTALRKNYQVQTVDLTKGQTLENVDVLVIAGAKRDLTERDIFEIDQFLLKGGNAVFLTDAIELLPGGVTIVPLDTNLKTVLSPLGLTVESNLLLDTVAEFANFQVGPGQSFILPYPFFIRLLNENFANHPIVQKIASVVVRFVSSVTLQEQQGIEYIPLMSTSSTAWQQAGPSFQTDPNNVPQASADMGGSQIFAVYASGMMPRLTSDTTLPSLQQWQEGADGQFELVNVRDENRRSRDEIVEVAQTEANVAVFADSDFVADAYLSDMSPVALVQNVIDYMTLGDALISIRSKTLGDAPLEQLEDTEKSLLKFFGMFFFPLVLAAYGFFRLWMRKKEERLLKL